MIFNSVDNRALHRPGEAHRRKNAKGDMKKFYDQIVAIR